MFSKDTQAQEGNKRKKETAMWSTVLFSTANNAQNLNNLNNKHKIGYCDK